MVKNLDTLNSYNELSKEEMVDTNGGGLILLGVATGIATAVVVGSTVVKVAGAVKGLLPGGGCCH